MVEDFADFAYRLLAGPIEYDAQRALGFVLDDEHDGLNKIWVAKLGRSNQKLSR